MKATDRFALPGVVCVLEGQPLPVINLSVSGLFVGSLQPPLAGQVLAVKLRMGGREFDALGSVTWVNERASPRSPQLPPGFGFRLTKMNLEAKAALIDALKRHRALVARKKAARRGDLDGERE